MKNGPKVFAALALTALIATPAVIADPSPDDFDFGPEEPIDLIIGGRDDFFDLIGLPDPRSPN